MVDCGPDLRQQLLLHNVQHIDGVLLTHEHYDHIGGLDDVRPLGAITVYAEKKVVNVIYRNMPYCFSENKYPGVPALKMQEIDLSPFLICKTTVQPVRVMHAKLPILGFRIKNVAYLTDVKSIEESEYDRLKNLDVLVLNALRIKTHIAHINLEEAIEIAKKIGAKQTYFTHLSHDMGKHFDVEQTLPENMHIAYDNLTLNV